MMAPLFFVGLSIGIIVGPIVWYVAIEAALEACAMIWRRNCRIALGQKPNYVDNVIGLLSRARRFVIR
jgi:hypothetical protein